MPPATPEERRSATIVAVRPKIGMEVHVELAAATKMFSRVPSPASAGCSREPEHEPNTLIDPVTLGLPGALPVPNRSAVELAIRVGLALGCEIAEETVWDRKSYFYPDLPKGYQTSQLDAPLCGPGRIELPEGEGHEAFAVRITRAHLEEDAGKLTHELPGAPGATSFADYNRAGTALLEIVTEPDFISAAQCVTFARWLRDVCRAVGATEGVMQRGHMRFEPNINAQLEFENGETVLTPIVEVKNLNSFRSVAGAIAHELKHQPQRWRDDGAVMGPGQKTTRGWDDDALVTFVQREKEDAHDYRYFPCPDLLPVRIERSWVAGIRTALPELPHQRRARYESEIGLGPKEAAALVEDPAASAYADACATICADDTEAQRAALVLVLQSGFRLANETGIPVQELGVTPEQVAQIARLRARGAVSAQAANQIYEELRTSEEVAKAAAERLGLLTVSDTGALRGWVEAALADPKLAGSVEDLRGGKQAAIGRIIGDVMQRSKGQADAKAVRDIILEMIAQ